MDFEIKEYQDIYKDQVAKHFDDFQEYLCTLDPLKRLRRLPGYGENALDKVLKDVHENDGVLYLALEKDTVIGFAVGILERQTEGSLLGVISSLPGRITELYVTPSFRGKGIGSSLMRKVEEYLKSKGCEVAMVEVFVPNQSARGLYIKLGYTERDIDSIKVL